MDKRCEHCDCDISFYSGVDEEHIGNLCPVCFIQENCAGKCGVTDEMASTLNRRAVARILCVCDIVDSLSDTMDLCHEINLAGSRPESGLDVDLSEHHFSTEVLGRIDVVAMETSGAMRALTRTFGEVFHAYPREATFVMMHHPASTFVRSSMSQFGA